MILGIELLDEHGIKSKPAGLGRQFPNMNPFLKRPINAYDFHPEQTEEMFKRMSLFQI